MDNTLLTGLSTQMVMRRNMDVVANNLANLSTTGFKSETVLFEEYLTPVQDAEGNEVIIHLVQDYGIYRNLEEGRFTHTGNDLDIALRGNGYLVVEAEDGTQQYTRNGNLRLSDEGVLTVSSGAPVLDMDGRKIQFEPDENDIDISRDGTLNTNRGMKAKLNLVEFENEHSLQKVGNNLFKEGTEAPIPSPATKLIQGMLESSNVNPILEMTRMIQISRSYQSAAKLMQANDELTRKAIEKLGKI